MRTNRDNMTVLATRKIISPAGDRADERFRPDRKGSVHSGCSGKSFDQVTDHRFRVAKEH